MSHRSDSNQQSAFSRWLRSGRLPVVRTAGKLELKFNPWHDPENGRFTFAGSGQYHGGGAGTRDHVPKPVGPNATDGPKVATRPRLTVARVGPSATLAPRPEGHRPVGVRSSPTASVRPNDQPTPVAEFVGGVGEGLYGAATETVTAVHSALTTNPATTVRNVGRGIARTIDTVVEAEDTPAAIQLSRAVDEVTHASAREIGRATGSVVASAAIAAVPGAALDKFAASRALREAALRPTYDPPQIGWVKENLARDTAARRYNDAAIGARPGQAPTLMRSLPNGSIRPVKFDGIEGEYVIDRKLKVVDAPHARAQLLRQSEALAQHHLIGTWEVPSDKQKSAALKLFKKMKVTNIKVRVSKP